MWRVTGRWVIDREVVYSRVPGCPGVDPNVPESRHLVGTPASSPPLAALGRSHNPPVRMDEEETASSGEQGSENMTKRIDDDPRAIAADPAKLRVASRGSGISDERLQQAAAGEVELTSEGITDFAAVEGEALMHRSKVGLCQP